MEDRDTREQRTQLPQRENRALSGGRRGGPWREGVTKRREAGEERPEGAT